MIRLIVITLFSLLVVACSNPTNKPNNKLKELSIEIRSTQIKFQVKTNAIEDLEVFEDGIIPWISIKNPEDQIMNLINKDKIILQLTEAILVIDYPLDNPIEIEVHSKSTKGFSRSELIQIVSAEYKRIYKEEEESAHTKTTPLEERDGTINRNSTDGKYGIWGHDLSDLDLSSIIIHQRKDSKPVIELFIES